MGKTLREKIASLSPERQAKIKEMSDRFIAEEMTLRALRQAREMTQVELARELNIGQEAVSRLEKRTDLHLSTLGRAVRAMGGELELIVKFSDRSPVKLSGFTDLNYTELEDAAWGNSTKEALSNGNMVGNEKFTAILTELANDET